MLLAILGVVCGFLGVWVCLDLGFFDFSCLGYFLLFPFLVLNTRLDDLF